MSFTESMHRIAHWLDREEEALLYEPDCGELSESFVIHARRCVANNYPQGIAEAIFPPPIFAGSSLGWSADDPLGLPMLDASED